MGPAVCAYTFRLGKHTLEVKIGPSGHVISDLLRNPGQKAVTAVAGELAGFVWSIGQVVEAPAA